MFCSTLAIVVNQKFLSRQKEMKLDELNLASDLKENTSQEQRYKEFFELFKDTDVRTVIEVTEAISRLIDNTVKKQNEKVKLEDLNIPYIND